MAPIPETVYSLLIKRQFAPDTTFTEKFIVLVIFGLVCLLYSVVWWFLASRVSSGSPAEIIIHELATATNGTTISNSIHLRPLVDNPNTGDPSPCRPISQCDTEDPISLARQRRDTRVVRGTVRLQDDEPVRFESEN
ncbi:unnamed protein product [Penicillium manginii]